MPFNEYQGLMNNTKWSEIRLAMYNYPQTERWRVKNINNGYLSNWDAECVYPLAEGGLTLLNGKK